MLHKRDIRLSFYRAFQRHRDENQRRILYYLLYTYIPHQSPSENRMLFCGRSLFPVPLVTVTLQAAVIVLVLLVLLADQSFVLGNGEINRVSDGVIDGDLAVWKNTVPVPQTTNERALSLSIPLSELILMQTPERLSRKLKRKKSKSSKKSKSNSSGNSSSNSLSNKSSKSSKSNSNNLSNKSSKSSKSLISKSLSNKSSKSSKSLKSNSLSDKISKSTIQQHTTETTTTMKQMNMEQSEPSNNEDKKGNRSPPGVKEKDPLVKETKDEPKPLFSSTLFQLALAAFLLAASLAIHGFRMKRSSTAKGGGHASGGAYKPLGTGGGGDGDGGDGGGEAEMTDLGHHGKNDGDDMDVDAEYGEAGSDDDDLGSPGFQRAQ